MLTTWMCRPYLRLILISQVTASWSHHIFFLGKSKVKCEWGLRKRRTTGVGWISFTGLSPCLPVLSTDILIYMLKCLLMFPWPHPRVLLTQLPCGVHSICRQTLWWWPSTTPCFIHSEPRSKSLSEVLIDNLSMTWTSAPPQSRSTPLYLSLACLFQDMFHLHISLIKTLTALLFSKTEGRTLLPSPTFHGCSRSGLYGEWQVGCN